MKEVGEVLGNINIGTLSCWLRVPRQWRRQSDASIRWATIAFGSLATISLIGLALRHTPTWSMNEWVIRGLLVVLILFPHFLYRFATAFRGSRSPIRAGHARLHRRGRRRESRLAVPAVAGRTRAGMVVGVPRRSRGAVDAAVRDGRDSVVGRRPRRGDRGPPAHAHPRPRHRRHELRHPAQRRWAGSPVRDDDGDHLGAVARVRHLVLRRSDAAAVRARRVAEAGAACVPGDDDGALPGRDTDRAQRRAPASCRRAGCGPRRRACQ